MAYNTIYDGYVITSAEELMGIAQNSTIIDLNGGAESVCVIPFAIPAVEPGTFTSASMSMNSGELITVLCSAAIRAMSTPQSPLPFPTGKTKYDADVASLMAIYASWTRNGLNVGEYYILGPDDVYNLLAQDPWTQGQINGKLLEQGYEGVSGNNGIPIIKDGLSRFYAPSKDAFKTQYGLPAVTDSNDVPTTGGWTSVVADEQNKSGYWWLYAGIAAAGLAAYGVVTMTKKRSGLR